MKPSVSKRNHRALTLVEVMAVIVVVALAFLVYASLLRAGEKAKRINCYSNLKAGGFAFRLWADDNNGQFPMELSTNSGGAREWVLEGKVFEVFRLLTNELATPKILVCPADSRGWATNWSQFDNRHLSYFVGVDARRSTNSADASRSAFLWGDRNLTNEVGPENGILQLTSNQKIGWTAALHRRRGNIGLADSAVLRLDNSGLREALQATGFVTNRLAIP
jgi:prepilin-type N-terminal cleavage/methylation domain-containing protein